MLMKSLDAIRRCRTMTGLTAGREGECGTNTGQPGCDGRGSQRISLVLSSPLWASGGPSLGVRWLGDEKERVVR